MKKISLFISIVLSLGILFTVISCNSGLNEASEVPEQYNSVETGTATFNIVLPDYYAMAKKSDNANRAIAPQSSKIRLSYKKNSNWIEHDTINLSEAEKTPIENAPQDFAGSVYKCIFENIPSGIYKAGNMKIELLDANDIVLSSGTNEEIVSIMMGEVTQAAFYTIPTSASAVSGSLEAGEMKFLRKQFDSEYMEILEINVSEGNTFPYLVLFNEKGMFEKIISISADNKTLDCSEYIDSTLYLGFWSPTATTYSTSFTISIPESALTNFETAFDNILENSEWTVTNASAITANNGVYTFDGKKQTGGFKRTIIISEPKLITFKTKTNLYEQYDGSLQFIVDGTVLGSFTGIDGDWENSIFELEPGRHIIEWKRVDNSSSYTSGITQQVSVKDFEVKSVSTTTTDLDTAFENILENSDWLVTGSGAITVENGVYTFDGKKQTGGFKRTVILSEAKTISFKVRTLLNETYDGYLDFLIDNTVMESFTGTDGNWQNAIFDIDAGQHTIEWKRRDESSSYTSGITQQVSVKDFAFGNTMQPLETINQTFEETIDSNMWIGKGTFADVIDEDPVFAAWAQYGDALVDTHQKVFKLGTYENSKLADSSLTIKKISVTQESALSFDYKCDLYNSCNFQVFIDNETTPAFNTTGIGQMWQKGSVILSEGIHSVTFSTKASVYSQTLTNSVYLDNITLAPNTIASVDIYPKGVQETYVGGDTIKFTAKALRSDGSVIDGKTVTWSSTSGTISSTGVFTPGSSSDTVTVTATIDEMTASNDTVIVHGTDYLTDPVTINGKTFTGTITNGSGSRSNTTNITWANPTPNYSSFTTDGFFVLKGTANNTYGYVKVTKGDYETYYILPPGNFEQRIWLRFGDGTYTVFVTEMEITYNSNYDGYEGDLSDLGGFYTSGESTTTFTVTNNSGLSPTYTAGECALLMPSYICQSDSFIVSNSFNAIMAELPESATLGQKLQALHDWEIHRNHYDNVSFNNTSKRKKQDAVSVVKYEMAVCEGYANLYAALARHLGVQTAYQSSRSMNHGWVECYYEGQWLLVDATWDDPVADNSNSYTEKNPTSENYKYFLIGRSGVSNDHYGNSTEYGRSVIAEPALTIPHMKNMPDGWY